MANRAAYDEDFYNWTQEQAALLRALPRSVTLPNALDLAHIAEEIADMGKSELRRVSSNIVQLMIHLIKLKATGLEAQASRHSVDEIIGFGIRAESHFTPGMRQLIDLPVLWREAKRKATQALDLYGDVVPPLPDDCPFVLDDFLADGLDVKSLLAALTPCERSGADTNR